MNIRCIRWRLARWLVGPDVVLVYRDTMLRLLHSMDDVALRLDVRAGYRMPPLLRRADTRGYLGRMRGLLAEYKWALRHL